MRRFFVALLLAGMFALAAEAAPVAAVLDVGARAVVRASPGSRVNVRAEPRVAPGNVVGKAAPGTEVSVLAAEQRGAHVWYRVRDARGGFEGWIRGDLLEPEAAPESVPEPDAGRQQAALGGVVAPPARTRRPREGWVASLEKLIPAIDGCVAQASAPPVVTLKVRELPLGLVEVLLEDASQRYWSCVIDRKGGTPLTWNPVPGPAALGTRRPDPVFYRQAAPTPDDCHDVEELRDERDGTLIGALVYDLCR